MKLLDPMEDPPQLKLDETGGSAETRRYPRTVGDLPVTLILGRWPWNRRRVSATLRDISQSGARLDIAPTQEDLEQLPWTLQVQHPTQVFRVGATIVRKEAERTYGVRFDHLAHEAVHRQNRRWHRAAIVMLAVVLSLLMAIFKGRNIISFWYGPLWQTYSLIAGLYVLSRVALSVFYREPKDQGILKTISVVIPVKNEETHIAEVIRTLFQSRYPSHLFEAIVVDDGSTDRTWEILESLQGQYPRLRLHRFEQHSGKRSAMAAGVEMATGEIVTFMDSDSLVDPEGLYRIVQPFHDPGVGAVAGHTLVIIDPESFISKMEAVRYFISQRVMKAAESLFGAVTCCPGPFSAYRRQAILDILPLWLHQTFMGERATFGDDRSLTNFILRRYRVHYHAGARCRTFVPNRWKTFIIQQLRWKKSWIREMTVAAPLMRHEHPAAALGYYASLVITLCSPFVVLTAVLYGPIVMSTHTYIAYGAGLFLVYVILGLVYLYHTQERHWYYGVFFGFLYAAFFSIQTYYAALTVRKTQWGTR